MLTNLLSGAGYLVRGFGMIAQPGLRRYFILPVTINVVVFSLLIYFASGYYSELMDLLLPQGESWWAQLLGAILWILFAVAALIIVFFCFTMVANLIGSPFNGLLAERVEQFVTGKTVAAETGMAQFLRGMLTDIFSELLKYGYFLLVALVLLVVTIIPGINLIAPFLWLVFGAWMLVLEYAAYPMQNHRLRFKQIRATVRSKRMLALGFGGATTLATMIPLVNLLVMPAAVAGATVMWAEQWQNALPQTQD